MEESKLLLVSCGVPSFAFLFIIIVKFPKGLFPGILVYMYIFDSIRQRREGLQMDWELELVRNSYYDVGNLISNEL